jgi:hypothetical protein
MRKVFAVVFIAALALSCCKGKAPVVTADMQNELMILVTPPKAGLENLMIRDTASRRILVSLRELKKNRIFLLPPGTYDISAAGFSSEGILLDSDCGIAVQGRSFLVAPFSQIAFSDGTSFFGRNIYEGRSYYLSILDLDKQQPAAYKAEIDGKNIPLAARLTGNRVTSASRISFPIGKITVNVTVNGDPSKVEPREFSVLDNDTEGPVLDKSAKYYYRSSRITPPLSFFMTDASGIDITKTYLEINGVKYYSEEALRERGGYRLTMEVPQQVFEGRHTPINALLRMYDSDTTHGPSDQASREENIVINEQTGFSKTFNFTWNGKPLAYTRIRAYSGAKGITPEMTMRDYNAVTYFSDNGIFNTAKDGAITLENMHDNDDITFCFLKTGQRPNDTVYTKTVKINGKNPLALSVDNIPPKQFMVVLQVTGGMLQEWINMSENEVFYEAEFYYKADVENDTLDPASVINGGSGFNKISAKPWRDGDDKMRLTVELDDISAQTHFNYLCVINFDNGTRFIMRKTEGEISPQPITLYMQ